MLPALSRGLIMDFVRAVGSVALRGCSDGAGAVEVTAAVCGAQDLPDGNRVHLEPIECLINFGRRWRGEANLSAWGFGVAVTMCPNARSRAPTGQQTGDQGHVNR